MKRRPPRNDQGRGNRKNSNPKTPDRRRLGPQKRIGPGHTAAPAKQVLLSAIKILTSESILLRPVGHVERASLLSQKGACLRLVQPNGRSAEIPTDLRVTLRC
jgi:hypothetical protein